MKRGIAVLLAVIALGLGGCAGLGVPPPKEELAKADYGRYDQKEAERAIHEYLDRVLYDPGSKHVGFSKEPRKDWERARRGEYYYGYDVHFAVNAKNLYGGYTGVKSQIAFMRDGQILRVYERNKSNTDWQIAHDYLPK